MIDGPAPPWATQENLLGLVLDSPDGILVVSGEGILLFINPAAERIFGRDGAHLLGYPLGLPLASREPAEITLMTGDGEPRTALIRTGPIRWMGQEAQMATMRRS